MRRAQSSCSDASGLCCRRWSISVRGRESFPGGHLNVASGEDCLFIHSVKGVAARNSHARHTATPLDTTTPIPLQRLGRYCAAGRRNRSAFRFCLVCLDSVPVYDIRGKLIRSFLLVFLSRVFGSVVAPQGAHLGTALAQSESIAQTRSPSERGSVWTLIREKPQ